MGIKYPYRYGVFSVVLLLSMFSFSVLLPAEEISLSTGDDHIRPVKYAEIEINGEIPERLPEIYFLRPGINTLRDILRRIEEAKVDKNVEGMVLRLGRFGGGWAKAGEIRDALSKLTDEGKETIVYLEQGGNIQYYIASAAQKIVLPHAGNLMLVGLRGEVMFLRGLFDKVGVKPDFVQVGDYKGASDPFVYESAPDEFDESLNSLFDSLFELFLSNVADGRRLSAERVEELIDSGPYTPRQAKEDDLVDEVLSYHELVKMLGDKVDAPFELLADYAKEEPEAIALGEGTQRLLKMIMGVRADWDFEPGIPEDPVIAVIYAVGPVVMQRPEASMLDDMVIDARLILRLLKRLKEHESVKAIVLRVESPGGDAQASDMIWQAVRRADRMKPVIASISDIGGSGGYYIASGARHIFANEGSLTGSIGVVGGKFVVSELFDKLGIHMEVYQRGQHAGLFSPIEQFSGSQREKFHSLLKNTYNTFLDRILDGRNISREELVDAAAGRPFTGKQALNVKLVDDIGGLNDAIQYAAAEAGIDEDYEVLEFPKSQSLLDAIFWGRDIGVNYPMSMLNRNKLKALLPEAAADGIQYLHSLSHLRDYQPAALMPELIRVR